MHPKMQFAILAARAQCWSILNLLSIIIPGSLSARAALQPCISRSVPLVWHHSRMTILLTFFLITPKIFISTISWQRKNQLLYFKSTELKEDYASGEFDAPFQILFQKQFREKETMALHNNCAESHFRVISAPICSLLLKSIASKKKKKKTLLVYFLHNNVILHN